MSSVPATRPATELELIDSITTRLADHNSGRVPLSAAEEKELKEQLIINNWRVGVLMLHPSEARARFALAVFYIGLFVYLAGALGLVGLALHEWFSSLTKMRPMP